MMSKSKTYTNLLLMFIVVITLCLFLSFIIPQQSIRLYNSEHSPSFIIDSPPHNLNEFIDPIKESIVNLIRY